MAAANQADRAPYVIAGVLAAAPLLALGAAAPGGGQWRWLEFPPHITVIALVVGVVACFGRSRLAAAKAVVAIVACSFAWTLIGTLMKSHGVDLVGRYFDLLLVESVGRFATVFVAIAYASLALLAVTSAQATGTNLLRAAIWLACVALAAIGLVTSNESWLTLENIGSSGTYRSSVAWPDTKVIALVAAVIVLAVACVAAVAGVRLRARPIVPRAVARERPRPD
jgi:hypothetical protein